MLNISMELIRWMVLAIIYTSVSVFILSMHNYYMKRLRKQHNMTLHNYSTLEEKRFDYIRITLFIVSLITGAVLLTSMGSLYGFQSGMSNAAVMLIIGIPYMIIAFITTILIILNLITKSLLLSSSLYIKRSIKLRTINMSFVKTVTIARIDLVLSIIASILVLVVVPVFLYMYTLG